MPALHSFAELLKHLEDTKVPHRTDSTGQVLELPSNASPPLSGNLYLKWEKSVPFVNLIQFMIDDVPADRIHDLETAIVRLDNILEVGGFGFDHTRNRLYVRLSVPVFPPGGVDWGVLNQLAAGVVRNGKEFVDTFKEILGGKPGDQVIELYRANKGKLTS